jgi:hypothetical protein
VERSSHPRQPQPVTLRNRPPQELAATWHLNQLDGTEFTNTKSWMATEFAFAGNKRGTVNSDPITELQTSTRSMHEGRYALYLESQDAAYRSVADPAHAILNYVGIIDPFGIADGINAVWYVGEGLMGREGAFLNAGISAAGALLPYAGDLLKFGKASVQAAEACGVYTKLGTNELLKRSAKSAVIGAVSGAAIGGGVSYAAGGDVLHGATQGALHGALGSFSRGFFLNRFAQACFTAGTPLVIDFDGNSKPIEQIQVGEMVLARNELEPHGPLELKRVEELFTRTSPIIELEIGGQKIGTTDEHPFYVPAREAFVPARELQVGDQLISHDGRLLRIDAIHATLQIATVYNLRVADYHTYFVGCDEWGWSVWAHNQCYNTKSMVRDGDDIVMYSMDDALAAGRGPMAGTSRNTGASRAWKQEMELVVQSGKGTARWTSEQIQKIKDMHAFIKSGGKENHSYSPEQLTHIKDGHGYKILGFTGHHINFVKGADNRYMAWQADPRNIAFLEQGAGKEHFSIGHPGGTKAPQQNPADLIDRQAMLESLKKRN